MTTKANARDITADLAPLHPKMYEREHEIAMYSFDTPAVEFWQGIYNALTDAGATHAEAVTWLKSKNARWLMDNDSSAVKALGKKLGMAYIKRNGIKVR